MIHKHVQIFNLSNYFRMKLFKISLFQIAFALLTLSGCSVDPEYHSETAPNTFYDSPERVYQRLGAVYSRWAVDEGMGVIRSQYAFLQELTSDEICMPVRGTHWLDGGYYLRPQRHDFTDNTSGVNGAWNAVGSSVARAWNVKEDLDKYVDFSAMFPNNPNARDEILLQLDVLVASFYLRGLDFFGGYPIYRSNSDPVQPRSTDVELFTFIDSLLTNALTKLPLKAAAGEKIDGYVNQAVAASLLARLYFNAEPYIRRSMYTECSILCNNIINGKYGPYALANDYRKIFGWGNETCDEIIWGVPSTNAFFEMDPGNYPHSLHYNSKVYLKNSRMAAWNGHCLMPSLDGNGKSYITGRPNASPNAFKLGSPFGKFDDADVRKKQYVYKGNGEYEGMFLFGLQGSVDDLENACLGDMEYKGEIINFVDQIAYMKLYGQSGFKEGIETAEENSGVRLMKFSPVPTEADLSLWYEPDVPAIRLAEIYYMLAECKFRANDKAGAVSLINNVRSRYFEGGNDPNPATTANLDKYRMLDEWLIEFLGEKRRRSDLVRWDEFTKGEWFDHKPDGPGKEHYNRFPVPTEALSANPLLEQNPGYN
jgi:hypothetical protein